MSFSVASLLPWTWILLRASGFILWWPLSSGQSTPGRIKVGLVLALVVVGSSQIDPSWALVQPNEMAQVLLGEFIVGTWMGFGTRLAFLVLEVGGHILSMEMGLSMAQSLNPTTSENSTTVETVFYYFGVLLAVLSGWHRETVGYWLLSYREFPPGRWWGFVEGIPSLGRVFSTLFAYGVQMAAPVIGLILLINLTFAFLGKVAPQVNVMMLSFSVRIGVGMVALIVVVLLARALFFDASSWLLPFTLRPTEALSGS